MYWRSTFLSIQQSPQNEIQWHAAAKCMGLVRMWLLETETSMRGLFQAKIELAPIKSLTQYLVTHWVKALYFRNQLPWQSQEAVASGVAPTVSGVEKTTSQLQLVLMWNFDGIFPWPVTNTNIHKKLKAVLMYWQWRFLTYHDFLKFESMF